MIERAILCAVIAGGLVAGLGALDLPGRFGAISYAIEDLTRECERDGWDPAACRLAD